MTASERQQYVRAMDRWAAKYQDIADKADCGDGAKVLAAAVDWLRVQGKFARAHCQIPAGSDWPDDVFFDAALYVAKLAGELRDETMKDLG